MKDYKPKLVCFSCKFGWGYLADQEHPLRDVAAEHRMRARDVAGICTPGARALFSLECGKTSGTSTPIWHGRTDSAPRAGIAGPEAISSAHRSTSRRSR